ncbi:MAG: quinol:electron acceptor oxidoreductase subunit ActD [bacterium]|nr:quinol:electron acceptor oxidoreductase subunit ActD [bacterium]
MIKKLLNKIKEFDTKDDTEPRSKKLFGLAALYNTPNEIIEAASVVAGKGYEKFDVYTPYPLHGMDDAMGMKESKVGVVSFIFGVTGTCLALLMIWWMSEVDYPNIIGGKPFFSLPPSIPITFEATILLTGLATVFGMLILFNKIPKINSPLNDTPFMKNVTSDKYGLVIKADDDKFVETDVKNLYLSTGAYEVQNIYYRESNLTTKTPLFDKKFIGAVIGTVVLTAIVSYFTLNVVLYDVVPFDWMWNQARIDSQSPSTFFSNKSGMRQPVNGTVARGFMPYEFQGMPDSLVKNLSNPLAVSKEVLERGQDRYNIYCSPCHGYFGEGDGRLKGQFPKPPTIHSVKVTNWPDGNIYHVITNGQNVMPSYSEQISRDDRWAIIHYMRALQRSKNASDDDLTKTK